MSIGEREPDDGRVPSANSLDGRGVLGLVALFAFSAAALGLVSLRVVAGLRHEQGLSATTWTVSIVLGAVIGSAAVVFQYLVWRHRGGQRVVHSSRRAVTTGELPEPAALRVAVLQEVERRGRELDRRSSAILAIISTANAVVQIASDPAPFTVSAWILIWGASVALAVRDLFDRRYFAAYRQSVSSLR